MATDLVNRLAACENKPSNFLTLTLDGTTQQVSAVDLFATSVTFYGFKAVVNNGTPTNNAGDTALGYTDYAGVIVAAGTAALLDTIPAGSAVSERAPLGTKYNLKDFWVRGTATDKIIVGYEA